jgi:hypothetical protein
MLKQSEFYLILAFLNFDRFGLKKQFVELPATLARVSRATHRII